ncbi:MAG: hypothetical protein N4J56_006487 [Chroococcidiopsis sp. SAG 2025]|uniref:hypothetical protein n=1 Tax=Chroococcidiopsis sp. SAG 2025 TaxID=171389 RepID=UPI0029372A6C|nr:hypothetical protein [Chroococcidiopsis sp. SAG 2025]MDV2996782.1 hypothetical protein [Chroococcidiopsis sp. SAG 2025]
MKQKIWLLKFVVGNSEVFGRVRTSPSGLMTRSQALLEFEKIDTNASRTSASLSQANIYRSANCEELS